MFCFGSSRARWRNRRLSKEKRQTACKPGSVRRAPVARSPTRRPFLCGAPRGAPDATNPGGGARTPPAPTMSPSRRRPPLFGLAPGGVYPAAPVTGGAVRSCRTVSPLPIVRTQTAVCFLWHCPWGRPRRPLAGTVFPWSPDFPPPLARQQPSSRLAPPRCACTHPGSSGRLCGWGAGKKARGRCPLAFLTRSPAAKSSAWPRTCALIG